MFDLVAYDGTRAGEKIPGAKSIRCCRNFCSNPNCQAAVRVKELDRFRKDVLCTICRGTKKGGNSRYQKTGRMRTYPRGRGAKTMRGV